MPTSPDGKSESESDIRSAVPVPGSRNTNGRDIWVNLAAWTVVIGLCLCLAWGASRLISWFRTTDFELKIVEYNPPVEEMAEDLIEVVPEPSSPNRPELGETGSLPAASAGEGVRIRNPSWRIPPGGLYPDQAMLADVRRGSVTLSCDTLATGEVAACDVLNETPTGYGFAQAAIRGTREARLTPRAIEDFETDSTITFTVRFTLQE